MRAKQIEPDWGPRSYSGHFVAFYGASARSTQRPVVSIGLMVWASSQAGSRAGC